MKPRFASILVISLCLIFTACSSHSSSGKSKLNSTVSHAADSYLTIGISSEDSSRAESAGSNTFSASAISSSTASNYAEQKQTVNVAIPEGYSVSQIGDLLESKGVCSKSDFLTQVNSYPFTESIMSKIPSDSNRCFRLEGYLFPNTYTFYTHMKAQDAIGKMLRSSDENIYGKYDDETIIIASIIQMECAKPGDMKNISSVIRNRLNSKIKLQQDSTINYIERYVKPIISGDINRYNSFYNTYKCSALPEGPICNPGKQALDAASSPSSTNYLYFVTNGSGQYVYSATYIDPKTAG